MKQINLFEKGCLGTCWYGNYHYLEPWLGCQHDCFYCYAKYRDNIINSLNKVSTTFAEPKLLQNIESLLANISQEIASQKINIVKLSRFTDIFTPSMVANGNSFAILETLCQSDVKRIIITTKSLPDQKIIKLFEQYREKISFNIALKPKKFIIPENLNYNTDEILAVSKEISDRNILTTVHMDPLLPDFDDSETDLREFFTKLQAHNLRRVMFSYLLLNREMLNLLQTTLEPKIYAKIESLYEITERQILPNQTDTVYFNLKDEIKTASSNLIAKLLREFAFEFVLCGLKNKNSSNNLKIDSPICNGKFYA